ncbi:CCA tRNA nucleotidyltransferase [Anaeromicrobium sediminis]|nr:HD domain-containing protein [Anaeromicrobium sediminis]
MKDKLNLLKHISHDIRESGGRIFFVGGYVRDYIMKKEPKDIDTETYGISLEKLYSILGKYGKVSQVGKSFGVLILKDVDFALPRKETKVSKGHKGFHIDTDPYLSYFQASTRRDFTMNAILMDVITNEIIDPHNGRAHIKEKIIKHINPSTFIEDPLRVYRAIQFASRFNFKIHKDTIDLCKKMDLSSLPSERIYEEFKKFLLFSDTPSISLKYMKEMNMLKYFPELKALVNCPQDKIHHPEGDVFNHTLLVLDKAASLKEGSSDPLTYMLGALCHDFGKPSTTEMVNGRIISHNHDREGVIPASTFLPRLTNEKKIIEKVCLLIKNHMKPFQFYQARDTISDKAFRKLSKELFPSGGINELLLLARADHTCRSTPDKEDEFSHIIDFFKNKINNMNLDKKFIPLVKGQDLINLGLKPSKEFSIILKRAESFQLEGFSKVEIISKLKSEFKL